MVVLIFDALEFRLTLHSAAAMESSSTITVDDEGEGDGILEGN